MGIKNLVSSASSHVNYQSLPRVKKSSKENKLKQPDVFIPGMLVCYTQNGRPSFQQVLEIFGELIQFDLD